MTVGLRPTHYKGYREAIGGRLGSNYRAVRHSLSKAASEAPQGQNDKTDLRTYAQTYYNNFLKVFSSFLTSLKGRRVNAFRARLWRNSPQKDTWNGEIPRDLAGFNGEKPCSCVEKFPAESTGC